MIHSSIFGRRGVKAGNSPRRLTAPCLIRGKIPVAAAQRYGPNVKGV